MSRCRACGKQVRVTKLAFILEGSGLKGGRVCQKCAADGVLLVSPKIAPVVEITGGDRRELREQLAPFIRNLEGKVKAIKAFPGPESFTSVMVANTRIETYEAVVAMLKEGRA